MRWIVFDAETADAVVTRLRRGAAEIHHEDPIDAALRAGETSVLVMPSREPGKVILARFSERRPAIAKEQPPASPHSPLSTPASTATAMKSWWKRRSA